MNYYLFIFHHIKKEWKHVRFKSTSKNYKVSDCSSKQARKLRIQALANSLDCNTLTAQEIVAKNSNVISLETDEFHRNVIFCQKYFKLSEVVECPDILSMNSSLLQHRYFSLMELGCKQVSAINILRFTSILKKSPKAWTKDGLSFSNDDLSALSRYLDESEMAAFSSKLHRMYQDGCSLKQIKEAMNAEFLVAKLGCSIGRAHQMFKNYPPLRVQSISNTDRILNILLMNLGFSPSVVLFLDAYSKGYTLSSHINVTIIYFALMAYAYP